MDRWRGRRTAGLALLTLLLLTASTATAAERPARIVVLVEGEAVASLLLPEDGRFALRYRNSVYRSTAEERFVADGGMLRLVELATDELAVLDEYYTATRITADRAGRAYRGGPAYPLAVPSLTVAATDRGERTLVVGGAELALWRLVDDAAPSVTLVVASGP